MSRIPTHVVAEVEERAAGYCEACGWPALTAAFHHRDARGMGGTGDDALRLARVDVAVNLLRVHPKCHQWIHAHPEASRERGWILRSGVYPPSVPVIVDPICR